MKRREYRKVEGYRFKSPRLPTPGSNKMPSKVDLTGQRFARLVAVETLGLAANGTRWWGCVCDCGEKVAVRSRELRNSHTRSCGCYNAEVMKARKPRNKLPSGEASRNELYASYVKSARSRDYDWELSLEDFTRIVTDPCIYCGAQNNMIRKPNKGVNGGFAYTGIDRLHNTEGYVIENCVACCWICNRAKGTLDVAEFLEWLDRVAKARSARFEHRERG